MSALKEEKWISEAEYWLGEESSPVKHEWFNGRVYAMAGGSNVHARLITRVGSMLDGALRDKKCIAVGSEQRVRVEATGLNTYPDASVYCEPSRFVGKGNSTLLTPTIIIEVLSPETEKYDRTQKFDHYKQIESLTDYLLISQDVVRVEHFSRVQDGWLLRIFSRRADIVRLPAVEIELSLEELYRGFDVPEQLVLWSALDEIENAE